MRGLLVGLVVAAAVSPALAESFDASVRRLCTGTRQQACWVKAGADLCPQNGAACIDVPDRAFARAIRKEGRRWLVETVHGTGWVQDRFMLVDDAR